MINKVALKKFFEQNKEDYLYAKIKQELKIEDLIRYGIRAIMVKEYSDITAILLEIEKRLKRKNIFLVNFFSNSLNSSKLPLSTKISLKFLNAKIITYFICF